MGLVSTNASAIKVIISIISIIVVLIVLGYVFLSMANAIPSDNEFLKIIKDAFRSGGILSIALAIIIVIVIIVAAIYLYKSSSSYPQMFAWFF